VESSCVNALCRRAAGAVGCLWARRPNASAAVAATAAAAAAAPAVTERSRVVATPLARGHDESRHSAGSGKRLPRRRCFPVRWPARDVVGCERRAK